MAARIIATEDDTAVQYKALGRYDVAFELLAAAASGGQEWGLGVIARCRRSRSACPSLGWVGTGRLSGELTRAGAQGA